MLSEEEKIVRLAKSQKKFYKRNKQKIAIYNREYFQKNKQAINARNRKKYMLRKFIALNDSKYSPIHITKIKSQIRNIIFENKIPKEKIYSEKYLMPIKTKIKHIILERKGKCPIRKTNYSIKFIERTKSVIRNILSEKSLGDEFSRKQKLKLYQYNFYRKSKNKKDQKNCGKISKEANRRNALKYSNIKFADISSKLKNEYSIYEIDFDNVNYNDLRFEQELYVCDGILSGYKRINKNNYEFISLEKEVKKFIGIPEDPNYLQIIFFSKMAIKNCKYLIPKITPEYFNVIENYICSNSIHIEPILKAAKYLIKNYFDYKEKELKKINRAEKFNNAIKENSSDKKKLFKLTKMY